MTTGEGGDVVELRRHKYAGKTREAQAKQLAALKPRAAVRHGAYSATELQPEYERVLQELVASFPAVRHDRLHIAAEQRARITLLGRYIHQVGLIRHRGRGETFPAVALLQREETTFRAELTKIEDLQREAGEAQRVDPRAALRAEVDGHAVEDGGDDAA